MKTPSTGKGRWLISALVAAIVLSSIFILIVPPNVRVLRASPDTLIYSDDEIVYSGSLTYVQLKSWATNTAGTLRIDFDLMSSDGQTVYGRVYKNGVAVGTERSTTSTEYVTFTESISGWSVGNTIEIWARTTNEEYYVYVQNFRVYILVAFPGKPVLISPENNTSTFDNTPTFTWTRGSNADNHRIEVDNEYPFSGALIDNVVVASPNDDTWTKTGTGYSIGSYWWRVVARNAEGENISENTWKLTVVGLPNKPILVSPENNTLTSDNTPTFIWTGGAYADNHRIEVDDNSDFSSPIDNVVRPITDNSWTKTGAGYALGTYYWRVWAINPSGENVSENTWKLNVRTPFYKFNQTVTHLAKAFTTDENTPGGGAPFDDSPIGSGYGVTYDNYLENDDASYWSSTPEETGSVYQAFRFRIEENVSTISSLRVKWNGYGSTGIVKFYAYKNSTGSWILLDNSGGAGSEVTYENDLKTIDNSTSNWLRNSDELWLCAEEAGYTNYLYSDYVHAEVVGEGDVVAPGMLLIYAGDNKVENSVLRSWRNNVHMPQNWMEVKTEVWDRTSISTVTLEWFNGTAWENFSMDNAGNGSNGGTYFKENRTGLENGKDYSFNIWTKDDLGNEKKVYEWLRQDNTLTWVRRYARCGYAITDNLQYAQFYLWAASYGEYNSYLEHEQKSDGSLNDTGIMYKTVPSVLQERYCGAFVGFFINENLTFLETTIQNIYVHVWWATDDNLGTMAYGKGESYIMDLSTVVNSYDISVENALAGPSVPTGVQPHHFLEAKLWDVTDLSYDSNDIYQLQIGDPSQDSDHPDWIDNRNYGSYIILNVPNNSTLQEMDSDNDGLNDYKELYVYFTDPHLSDTDNDGIQDNEDANPLNTLIPMPLSPSNNAFFKDNTPTFTWIRGLDADNHRIEVDDNSDFSSPIDNENIASPGDNTWTKPSPGYALGTYYWRVWAHFATEERKSIVWTFTVANSAPEVLNVYITDMDNIPDNTLDVDTWYKFKVEIRDNDNLSDIQSVELRLYENSLTYDNADNTRNHYGFEWTRENGFKEIGSSNWTMFRNDVNNTGYTPDNGPLDNTIKWSYETTSSVESTPTVVSGKIYIGDDAGKFYCLNADDGTIIWNYQTNNSVDSSATVVNGKVYFGSYDDNVYCLNADNGELIWNYTTGSDVEYSSPAIANGKLYIGSYDGKVYCLNSENGDFIWSYTTGSSILSSPAIVGSRVYIGSNDLKLYCLNADNGDLVWSYTTNYGWVVSSPTVVNGKVYAGCDWDNMYCLNADNGELIWNYETGDTIMSSPAVIDGKVYIGSYNHKVYCFNADNGELIWDYTTNDRIFSSPVIANKRLYIGSDDDNVYCLNADNGDFIWSYQTGADVLSSPAVVGGRIYIGSDDHNVYCFGTFSDHLLFDNCTAGNDNLTTDNWVFVVKLDGEALSGTWSAWARVIDNSGAQDNHEFANWFTVAEVHAWVMAENWSASVLTLVAWVIAEAWTGIISAPAAWTAISSWTGIVQAPANWIKIEQWSGTVNALANWITIESWSATLETTVGWNIIEAWDGTVSAPVAWIAIEAWSATINATVSWNSIETWSASATASANWTTIESWMGTITASAGWGTVETWTGTVNSPANWNEVETWVGTVQAPVGWQVIETWSNNTVNAQTAAWISVESWTGTISALAAWQSIDSWTGTVTTVPIWRIAETWTSTVQTLVEWQQAEEWSTTVNAPAEWESVETWANNAVNAPVAWNLIESWTGTVNAEVPGWSAVETWTGTISSPVAWTTIETWTGTIYIGNIWWNIETWTGTTEAPAVWNSVETWAGTIQAPAEWITIEIWTGTVNALTGAWQSIEAWTGIINAQAVWTAIEIWTGTVQTPTQWQIIEMWSGTIAAPSLPAWYAIETWIGTVWTEEAPPPPAEWHSVETWVGTANAPCVWIEIETWTGYVGYGWHVITSWIGYVEVPEAPEDVSETALAVALTALVIAILALGQNQRRRASRSSTA